ncbi:MAG: ParB N-terminal domain-containing protein [Thalassobaculaceae bacterium]
MTKATVQIDRQFAEVPIAHILVGERARAVDPDWVRLFASSMRVIGQCQPIVLRPGARPDLYWLVAGEHRLEAAKLNGGETVFAEIRECTDEEAKQIEVDENLIRNQMSVLEISVALHADKERYLALFPDTKNGAKGGRGAQQFENDKLSFSKTKADKTGLSRRTIERFSKIGESLTPELRNALSAHPIADNQAQLLKLAKLPPETRTQAVGLLTRAEEPVATVQDAVSIIEKRPAPKQRPAYQKQYDTLYRAFHGANAKAKRMFLEQLLAEGELDAVIATATRTEEAA